MYRIYNNRFWVTLTEGLLIWLLLGVSAVYAEDNRYLFVENAKLVPPSTNSGEASAVSAALFLERTQGGHRVTGGKSIVLLLREYDDGKGRVDADTFTKVSIQLDKLEIGTQISLRAPAVRVFYSSGGSSWVQKGWGHFTDKLDGFVLITGKQDDLLTVELTITGNAGQANDLRNVKKISIHSQYQLRRVSLMDLDPWLGKDVSAEELRDSNRPAYKQIRRN